MVFNQGSRTGSPGTPAPGDARSAGLGYSLVCDFSGISAGAQNAHRCLFGTTVAETSLAAWAKACWTKVGTMTHLS